MSTGLDLEAVLRDHRLIGNHCWCDRSKRLTHHEHVAHVAAVLRVEIESALADAWDEGARHGWGLFDMAFRYVERDNPYRPNPCRDRKRSVVDERPRPDCTCHPARIDGYLIHRQDCARSVTSNVRCPNDGQTLAWHRHAELDPDGTPRTNAAFIGCDWAAIPTKGGRQ